MIDEDDLSLDELDDTEEKFIHIGTAHMGPAMMDLLIAISECSYIQDERAVWVADRLDAVVNDLVDIINDLYDTIPGLMSREEAEAAFDRLMNGGGDDEDQDESSPEF